MVQTRSEPWWHIASEFGPRRFGPSPFPPSLALFSVGLLPNSLCRPPFRLLSFRTTSRLFLLDRLHLCGHGVWKQSSVRGRRIGGTRAEFAFAGPRSEPKTPDGVLERSKTGGAKGAEVPAIVEEVVRSSPQENGGGDMKVTPDTCAFCVFFAARACQATCS